MDDVKPWWAEVLWVVTAASGGVAISTLGSNVLHWPRSWFLVPYVSAVNTFLYGYYRWSGMDVGQSLRHRWRMGIVGAILMRSVMVWGVLRQPASPPPEGLELAMALLWLGVIYGAVDGAFLTVMAVLAIQRACATLGVPSHGSGPPRSRDRVGGEPVGDHGLSLGVCGIPWPCDRATPDGRCPHHPRLPADGEPSHAGGGACGPHRRRTARPGDDSPAPTPPLSRAHRRVWRYGAGMPQRYGVAGPEECQVAVYQVTASYMAAVTLDSPTARP
jgi:hypothetical protein